MKKTNGLIMILLVFAFTSAFSSASTNGTLVGNETNTLTNISAELDVVANLSATNYWAEVSLNTSEINFGYVEKSKTYRKSYEIIARGNVDIRVIPSLDNLNDNVFSNLYFSRTTMGWKKIGSSSLGLIFNLTQNKGLWTAIGASDSMKNVTGSERGAQNIQLDLTGFDGIVPFDESYKNTVKFVIVPDWTSVE